MLKINVLQKENELLFPVIKGSLLECDLNCKVLLNSKEQSDIAILSNDTQASFCDAKILIIPNSKVIKTTASEIITYGLCCKNTLTVSSFIENNMVFSLQRAIRSIGGKRIDVQDFPAIISDADEPEVVLAAVSVLLAADVQIAKISSLPF